MPGSDTSNESASSYATAYSSLSVEHRTRTTKKGKEKVVTATPVDVPVPADAPQLPQNHQGLYDVESGSFYAVDKSGVKASVARWSVETGKWFAENGKTLGKALINATPSFVQGAASNFMEKDSKAQKYTNGAGLAAQVGLSMYEGYQAYQGHDHHPIRHTAARAAGVTSAVANLAGNFAPDPWGRVASGVGTGLTAASATLDVVTGLEAKPPVYQQGNNNVNLGYEMGNVAPGFETPNTSSQTSIPEDSYARTSGFQSRASATAYQPTTSASNHYYPHASSSAYQPTTSSSAYPQASSSAYQPTGPYQYQDMSQFNHQSAYDSSNFSQHESHASASSSNPNLYQHQHGQPHGR